MAGIEPAISFACGACSSGRSLENRARCPSEEAAMCGEAAEPLAGVEPASWRSWSLRVGSERRRASRVSRGRGRVAPGRRRAARRGARGALGASRPLGRRRGSLVRLESPGTRVGARVRNRTGAFPLTRRVLVRSSYAGDLAASAGASRRQHRHSLAAPQGARFIFLLAVASSSRRLALAFRPVGAASTCVFVLSSQGGELLFRGATACDRQSPCPGLNRILPSTKRVLVQSSYAGKCLRCSASSSRRERGRGRRRQVKDCVRPSDEAGSFQTRSKNERLYQLGYRAGSRPWAGRTGGAGGASWIRTNISIACMTLSSGRTQLQREESNLLAPTWGARRSSDALKCSLARVRKPFLIAHSRGELPSSRPCGLGGFGPIFLRLES